MSRIVGLDVETRALSPRCKPWAGHPGLFIVEPDYSGIELRVMELVSREEQRRAARRPLQVFRPVLPPFWPRRPARDPKRPGANLPPAPR